MKKVLLLSLSLALGFSAFAQQRVAKAEFRSATAKVQKELAGKETSTPSAAQFAPQTQQSVVVNRYEETNWDYTIATTYDLQSNQYVANRMFQLPNGSVATTSTMSHEYNQTASDRGTGYNFYNGEEWVVSFDDLPEMLRVEPFKTGWPSIAQWKENGEILLAHGNGHMQCFLRETAGEGEWEYKGALPDYPDGYAYTSEYPTWPRVVTCGDNHDIIIAVAVLQHSISSDETDLQTVMWRSTDAENWTITYGPLQDVGWDHNQFSADDYCMAANGHNVALLYSGCLTNSTWLFKSTDDGLTWNATRVWENPYEGREFDEEPAWGMEDTLFMPMNGAVVIDNNGVVHVALNTFEMAHTLDNEPGYYSYWSGRAVDGILYWNDTQDGPIADTYHPEYANDPHLAGPNPHHAARLWWPIPGEPGYVHMVPDSTKWIGYIPMYEGYEWSNDDYYMSGTEYTSKFYGASGHPALSCDPYGNLACAFSSPNCSRYNTDKPGYYRSIYVSYRNVDKGYWEQLVDDLTDDFMFSVSECLFTFSALNTINPGEFWFGFQADDQIGFYWGSNASQTDASDNDIIAIKVIPDPDMVSVPEHNEAINPMTAVRVYPNPATDVLNIEVNASQSSEMSINVFNIMGQKVMEDNVNINAGVNTPTINTADFASGIYFVTVKANGFENTMKFIVK
jgi:hypothetical protein